jgi:hypothetical protein
MIGCISEPTGLEVIYTWLIPGRRHMYDVQICRHVDDETLQPYDALETVTACFLPALTQACCYRYNLKITGVAITLHIILWRQ